MIEIKTERTQVAINAETRTRRWHTKYFTKAINSTNPAKRMRNRIVDMIYVRLLQFVKELYSNLPNESDRIVCERNRKFDRSCPEAIWNFATPTFRMNLKCDALSEYWIDYDFNKCPFEPEIMTLFKDCGLNRYMSRVQSLDYSKYFNNLLTTYPDHIYTLKPTQS